MQHILMVHLLQQRREGDIAMLDNALSIQQSDMQAYFTHLRDLSDRQILMT